MSGCVLYVCYSRAGLVKIGFTSNPAQRERDHRARFNRLGHSLDRFVVSGSAGDMPRAAEWFAITLVGLALRRRPLFGREWFFCDDPESIVDLVADAAAEEFARSNERAAHAVAALALLESKRVLREAMGL